MPECGRAMCLPVQASDFIQKHVLRDLDCATAKFAVHSTYNLCGELLGLPTSSLRHITAMMANMRNTIIHHVQLVILLIVISRRPRQKLVLAFAHLKGNEYSPAHPASVQLAVSRVA